jgi:hypothetical protein
MSERRWSAADGRYPHYLAPLGERKPVTRVICVDPVGELHSGQTVPTSRWETLRSWHAVVLRSNDGALAQVCEESSEDESRFWELVQHELRHPGITWIVSWQCGRAWALLDIWAEFQSGMVRMAAGDARAVLDPLRFGQTAHRGLLVAEDPPNLCEFRVGQQPGIALWLDCRNWGIELPVETARGRAVSVRLAELVKRLTSVARDCTSSALSYTAAAHAWRMFRATEGAQHVHCHAHQEALELERAAHVGGRAECFRIGVLPYKAYHLDFRSHYGAIMAQEKLPVKLVKHDIPKDQSPEMVFYRDADMIARVTIETDEPAYPLVRDTDIIFPVGMFETVLCGPELVDAVKKCRVVSTMEYALYEMAPAAAEFAREMWAIRNHATNAGHDDVATWAKSVMVSLAGKLGYRHKCWEVDPLAVCSKPWDEWYQHDGKGGMERWRSLGSVCQREITGGYGPDACPAMAAFITSYGRMRLLQAIRTAGWENVVYCDTDSLVVYDDGLRRLRAAGYDASSGLGDLILCAGPSDVEICGVKHYVTDGRVKCSGSPKGVYVTSADGQRQWYTPAVASGPSERQPVGSVSRLVSRPTVGAYTHGTVMPDGAVRPFELGGSDEVPC